jgi:hypothetical protein
MKMLIKAGADVNEVTICFSKVKKLEQIHALSCLEKN